MKYPKNLISIICAFSLVGSPLYSKDENKDSVKDLYTVRFEDIPIAEFVRFVGRISKESFVFNSEDLNFNISFSSGQPISSENLTKALIRLLKTHQLQVVQEDFCILIHKGPEKEPEPEKPVVENIVDLIASREELPVVMKAPEPHFCVYKLQYHEGGEIVDSLRKIAGDLGFEGNEASVLSRVIQTLQWIKMTNSLLFSGEEKSVEELNRLIASLDVPLKQVFIEVLVIETDVRRGLEFGLQWAAGGKFQDRLGFGLGNFAPYAPGVQGASFTEVMKGISASRAPTGLSQVPIVPGFDLGVIGDIITHKGLSYLSLGSLVSALQADADSTIVLNQKIITQDNKNSKIFVGENIPFTGSIVTTVGQSQQSAANIEYRDVGVSLNITPMLGEGDIITLNLDEEITEAIDEPPTSSSHVTGIRTTKTNMMTHVHVPDRHFLVLSGMIRNAKSRHKSGIPCLGGLPWVGALFSKKTEQDRKRNVVIFVRPQIINSFEDYKKITSNQEKVFQEQSNEVDFSQALQVLPPVD